MKNYMLICRIRQYLQDPSVRIRKQNPQAESRPACKKKTFRRRVSPAEGSGIHYEFVCCRIADYIMPGAPPAGMGGMGSLILQTAASVVRKLEATLVAFCRALLVTLAGSRMPASIMSTYSSL